MSALTVTNLLTTLQTITGSSDTSALQNALQSAIDMIDTNRCWRYQLNTAGFPTVVNQVYYDLGTVLTDFGRMLGMYMTNPSFRRMEQVDGNFYLSQLASQSEASDYAQYYWFEGDQRIRIWPTPVSVYTVQCYYARYHGDITAENAVIYIPSKFKDLILHLAKQFYKGQINAIDKMLESDPYVSGLWSQMVAREGVKDTSYRQSSNGWGRFQINAVLEE